MLNKIITHKREQLKAIDVNSEIERIKPLVNSLPPVRSLKKSLLSERDVSIIAEIKKSSPSKGILNADLQVADTAKVFEKAGARAISVLTEDKFFGGAASDISIARNNTSLPVLRKDFILTEYQVWESRLIGADAILLIVAILDFDELSNLYSLAQRIGLEAIIEVHDSSELKTAASINSQIIGINNRNLKTFITDIKTSEELLPLIPKGTIGVSESGISTRSDMMRLRKVMADAALIGEGIVTSPDPLNKIIQLRGNDNDSN